MWSLPLIAFLLAYVESRAAPIVETNFGIVRGKWMKSARNHTVAAYLGIPYAEPPIGELRFQSPKPWTTNFPGIRDAVEDGPMCVQLNRNGNLEGQEDCLVLNVFVPQIANKRKLAVMVFVHGGAFNMGNSNSSYFAPDYLMDHEVILVTLNYRVGILGFLSTATERVPGNAGIKDVLEALKWVQDNIENFGGDNDTVTLFGHSSGAVIVHHLALSDSTEGLFDKYITQSGSAVAPWAIHPPFLMRKKYLVLAEDHGCTTESKIIEWEHYVSDEFDGDEDEIAYNKAVKEDERILACLRRLSPSRLANALSLFHVWNENPACNFGPTVEVHSSDPIITRHPLTTIQHGEFRDIPWITGTVSDEGLIKTMDLIQNRGLMNEFINNFDELPPSFLECDEIVSNVTAFVSALARFYFTSDLKFGLEKNLTKMVGDGLITWPTYEALNYQAELMNSSAYFYLFSYEGTFSNTYSYGIPRRYGVSHGDDLNYLFPCLNRKYADLQLHNTANDWTIINVMTELWSSFAKTGIPNARLTPDWEPYQDDNRYLKIGSGRSPDIRMKQDFLSIRMGFWEYLMGNVTGPKDILFLEDYTDEPEELEQDSESSIAIAIEPSCFTLAIILFSVNCVHFF